MRQKGKTKQSAPLYADTDKRSRVVDELEPSFDLAIHGSKTVRGVIWLDVTAYAAKGANRPAVQTGWVEGEKVEIFPAQPDVRPPRPRKPRIDADDMRVLLIVAALLVFGVSALVYAALK